VVPKGSLPVAAAAILLLPLELPPSRGDIPVAPLSPQTLLPLSHLSFLNQTVACGQACPLTCFISAWQTPSSLCLLPQAWPRLTAVPPKQN